MVAPLIPRHAPWFDHHLVSFTVRLTKRRATLERVRYPVRLVLFCSVPASGTREAAYAGRDSCAHVSVDTNGFCIRDVDGEEKGTVLGCEELVLWI